MPKRGQKLTDDEKAARAASTRSYWQRMTRAAKSLRKHEGFSKMTRGMCSRFWARLERWGVDEAALLAGDPEQVELLREKLQEEESKMLTPDLAGRIKIMMWAVKECGGAELARDALERAAVALGE